MRNLLLYGINEGERKKWDRGDACREAVHKLVFICVRAVKCTSEAYLHSTPTNNTVFNEQTRHSDHFVVNTIDTRYSFSLAYQFASISLKTSACSVTIRKGMLVMCDTSISIVHVKKNQTLKFVLWNDI